MRPSAKQLLESIDWSLQHRVAPVVEDKWAASTLRSVHCLLQHLEVRVETEAEMLHDDNLDARRTLEEVAVALSGPSLSDERAAIGDALVVSQRDASQFPTAARLTDERVQLHGEIDRLVRLLHGPAKSEPAGPEAAALALLDEFLARSLQRQQPLFVPAFLASTF